MIRSKRLLAAGFAAALGVAGFGLGSGSIGAATASAGGGVCEGIDMASIGSGDAAPADTTMGTDAMTEGTDHADDTMGTDVMGTDHADDTMGTDVMGTDHADDTMGTDVMGTDHAGTDPAAETEGTTAADSGSGEAVKVAVLFDVTGRGDKSFNDAAAAGLDRAVEELGVEGTESTPSADGDRAERLNAAVADGNQLVVAVGFLWTDTVTAAASENPDTHFAIIDSVVEADNVASLVFAEEQGSFLVGAAAAMQSESGTIGFMGGVPIDLIKKFEAGYVAGATCVNPDINILIEYVSDDPTIGFNDPTRGNEIGAAMYDGGADVVYAAAGGSGDGVLQAAAAAGAPGDLWYIGVDSDQYNIVDAELQPYVLTSMLKRVDVATFNIIEAEVNGEFAAGVQVFDLSVDGVGYATSGGFVDEYAPTLDGLKALIVDGTITVPAAPEG